MTAMGWGVLVTTARAADGVILVTQPARYRWCLSVKLASMRPSDRVRCLCSFTLTQRARVRVTLVGDKAAYASSCAFKHHTHQRVE
jgi:hypothetical protein